MLKSAPFPLFFFFSPSHFADRARVSYGKNKSAEGTQTHSSAMKPGFCLSGASAERVERAPGSRLKMTGAAATWDVCRCPLLFLLLLLGTKCHMLHGQGKSFALRNLGIQVCI